MFETNILEKEENVTARRPETSNQSEKRHLKRRQKTLMRKEMAGEIISSVWPLQEGEEVDVISNGQSNAAGFYEVLADRWEYVAQLNVSTWIINRYYIELLLSHIQSKKLGKLVFIISNRMSQMQRGHLPNFNFMKVMFSQEPNITFAVRNTHAKIFSMTNKEEHITVSGSGNWTENPRIENYTITNDQSKYKFHESWMTKLALKQS